MSRFLRPGWIVLYVIAAVWGWSTLGGTRVHFDRPLVVEEGDTLSSILSDQGWLDSRMIRRAASRHGFDPSTLAVGTYSDVTGSLSVADFYEKISKGPGSEYLKVTVLEGWSIYDTDKLLTDKGLIRSGEYVNYVTDPAVIRDLRTQYSFLEILPNDVDSLEGFLYPDTFFIDGNDPIMPQLVGLQLKSFRDSIWVEYGNDIIKSKRWSSVNLSSYELLVAASVVLKEERNATYQPLIAGVFLNRLQEGMRIDADITLCYGLAQPYESCTPSVIVQHLNDASNKYNTRAVKGLPPTVISSLTPSVVRAAIAVEDHGYFYYLHDKTGVLHPATTLTDHSRNKNQYLQ